MAKYGRYGWTPKQMERINERRAAMGQKELRNLYYEDRPQEERQRPVSKPAQETEEPEEEDESLVARQAKRTEEFRKKFGAKGSMGIERGVKSSFPSILKGGVKGGVGTSTLTDAYNRGRA